MKINLILLTLFISASLTLSAQLDSEQEAEIDSLFLSWNQPNHPGGTIGILIGDDIEYQKSYGLASLDYLVPNQPSTIFNLASVSKQFTAMGILLLEKQGKLSVDDKISKYIPNLSNIGDKITIRHMLHHTSGIRSFHELLWYAGWRWGDNRTNEDIYRLMEDQVDLNFEPGEEYMYCNTGYIYMAYIIEKISGETFPVWMKTNVFEPLGMKTAYVEDRPSSVIPGNATSYFGSAVGGFERAIDYWSYVGSGNMHATIYDLIAWGKNFYDPKPGWEELFQRIQTTDAFNNGKHNQYAFGVNVMDMNGLKVIRHGGSIGGFRTDFVVLPDEETVITVLTNHSSSNPGGKTNDIIDIITLYQKQQEESAGKEKVRYVKLKAEELSRFEGSYWTPKNKYTRKIYLRNDTLRYERSEGNESPIVPISKNQFKMLGLGATDIIITFSEKDDDLEMKVTVDKERDFVHYRFEETAVTNKEMASYAGVYKSEELDVYYHFIWEDEQLIGYQQRHGYFENIKRVKKDVLNTDEFIAEFQRDEAGVITGVQFTSSRVRNLKLVKVVD
jgi:CubicO group peptidase (beta-lactamase class C family)